MGARMGSGKQRQSFRIYEWLDVNTISIKSIAGAIGLTPSMVSSTIREGRTIGAYCNSSLIWGARRIFSVSRQICLKSKQRKTFRHDAGLLFNPRNCLPAWHRSQTG